MTKWYPKPVLLPEKEICEVLTSPKLSQLSKLRLVECMRQKTQINIYGRNYKDTISYIMGN